MTVLENNRTEPFIATYLHQKGARLGLPISGTFELTSRCNFSCPMCYVHSCKENEKAKKDELSAKSWISLAQEAKKEGMMFALLTGGEPFVREDFFEIYNAMKNMGLMISINSNGSLLYDENLEKLLENPPFRINISLYGAKAETYINMCKVNALDKVRESILSLKKAGVDVRLNLSLTPWNMQDIEEIYEFSKNEGLHIKCNTYMYPPLRKNGVFCEDERFTPEKAAEYALLWDKLRLTEEQFESRLDRILELCPDIEDTCSVEVDEGIRCRAGRSSFWIAADGTMFPCGMMAFPCALPLESGFKPAWEYIKEQSRVLSEPMKCRTCPKRMICNHCAAVCVTETGTFDKVPEYMCMYSDELLNRAKMLKKGGYCGD